MVPEGCLRREPSDTIASREGLKYRFTQWRNGKAGTGGAKISRIVLFRAVLGLCVRSPGPPRARGSRAHEPGENRVLVGEYTAQGPDITFTNEREVLKLLLTEFGAQIAPH